MTIKSLVYQSAACDSSGNVIKRHLLPCLTSVELTSKSLGFDYIFDDCLFDIIPKDIKIYLMAHPSKLIATDYARVLWIRKYLQSYDRVYWLDADVAVRHVDAFKCGLSPESYVFSREYWHMQLSSDLCSISSSGPQAINNSMMCFSGQSSSDWYVSIMSQIIEIWMRKSSTDPTFEFKNVSSSSLAAGCLGHLKKILNFNVFNHHLLVHPRITYLIASDDKHREVIDILSEYIKFPIYSMNLTIPLVGQKFLLNGEKIDISPSVFEKSVDNFLSL